MKALPFNPEQDQDECLDFDDWWAFILRTDPTWATGRGDARREWYKRRPNAQTRFKMKRGVRLQSQTEKWKAGYRTTPARWIRGEHEDDYVPEVKVASGWSCPHEKPCHNAIWCQVVTARERGEIA